MSEKKHTVLIVEDVIPLAKAAAISFKRAGLESIVVASVSQAEKALSENKIDAIWLDHYLLGERKGLDLLKIIKSEQAFKDIPVFLISNTATEETIEEYREAGIAEYFLKASNQIDSITNAIMESLSD